MWDYDLGSQVILIQRIKERMRRDSDLARPGRHWSISLNLHRALTSSISLLGKYDTYAQYTTPLPSGIDQRDLLGGCPGALGGKIIVAVAGSRGSRVFPGRGGLLHLYLGFLIKDQA